MSNHTDGVKTRAEIDTELVRGLLFANGGASVALLAFLATIFGAERLLPLATPVVVALFVFHLGGAAALVHNHYRRKCSRVHERHNFSPPPGKFLWVKLGEPGVCATSRSFMWLSIGLFLAGGIIVFIGALRTLG
jgi:hypothetical protein